MLSHDIKNALIMTRLCQYLLPQELDMLIIHNRIVSFSKGKVILEQGGKNDSLYIIIQGKVKITAKILGEGAVTLAILERGNFLGEISLIDNAPNPTTAIALEAVTALRIDARYFDMLALFFPQTRYKITHAIAKEIYYRLQDEYYRITHYMNQVNMESYHDLGEMIKSTQHPSQISFEQAGIDINDLARYFFSKNVNEEEWKKLLAHVSLLETSKNYTLIREQDRELSCYIVLSGAVQSSINHNNRIGKLSVLGPNTLFASLSCIDSAFASFVEYTTCEKSLLLRMSEAQLMHIQQRHTPLWYKLFEVICRSFVRLERSADKLDIRLNSELYNR